MKEATQPRSPATLLGCCDKTIVGYSSTMLSGIGAVCNAVLFILVPEDMDFLLWSLCGLPLCALSLEIVALCAGRRQNSSCTYFRSLEADSLVAAIMPLIAGSVTILLMLLSILGRATGRGDRVGVRDISVQLLASLGSVAILWLAVAAWQFTVRHYLMSDQMQGLTESSSGYGTPDSVDGGNKSKPHGRRMRWASSKHTSSSVGIGSTPDDSDSSHFGKTAE